jgi:hypothetical protein
MQPDSKRARRLPIPPTEFCTPAEGSFGDMGYYGLSWDIMGVNERCSTGAGKPSRY